MSVETIHETLRVVDQGCNKFGIIDGPSAKPVNLNSPALRGLWGYRADRFASAPDAVKTFHRAATEARVEIVCKLHKQGFTRRAISAEVGITTAHVGKLLRRGGISARNRSSGAEAQALAAKFKAKPATMSIRQWAQENGVSHNQAQYVAALIKHGKI